MEPRQYFPILEAISRTLVNDKKFKTYNIQDIKYNVQKILAAESAAKDVRKYLLSCGVTELQINDILSYWPNPEEDVMAVMQELNSGTARSSWKHPPPDDSFGQDDPGDENG
jgi:hypothetical protein